MMSGMVVFSLISGYVEGWCWVWSCSSSRLVRVKMMQVIVKVLMNQNQVVFELCFLCKLLKQEIQLWFVCFEVIVLVVWLMFIQVLLFGFGIVIQILLLDYLVVWLCGLSFISFFIDFVMVFGSGDVGVVGLSSDGSSGVGSVVLCEMICGFVVIDVVWFSVMFVIVNSSMLISDIVVLIQCQLWSCLSQKVFSLCLCCLVMFVFFGVVDGWFEGGVLIFFLCLNWLIVGIWFIVVFKKCYVGMFLFGLGEFMFLL